jgi:methylenetetrahydrofolate dehydrogenase (NADP+)/methenyltetrahydrofolate cyclohydrolase
MLKRKKGTPKLNANCFANSVLPTPVGHKSGSAFHFPLSLSVLSAMKYIALRNTNNRYEPDEQVIIDFQKDTPFLKSTFKDKSIVIAGRGITGGKPIAKALSDMEISYEMIHTQSENNKELLKNADIIITATGTKLLTHREDIKPGVILLNVGLRKEEDKLRGDYDEREIEETASYFTQTPGGLGPLDVLYLYKNLYDASLLS